MEEGPLGAVFFNLSVFKCPGSFADLGNRVFGVYGNPIFSLSNALGVQVMVGVVGSQTCV